MNASQLQAQLHGAVSLATRSGETTIAEALAALEVVKLDIYCNLREASKQAHEGKRIVRPPNGLNLQ